MRIIKKIKADVARYNTFDPIPAKQSDAESRFLEVTLTNDGEALTVPADSTVTINARRSDGECKSFEGSVTDDGAVLVPLTSWMLELDDIVQCDISVISGTEKLTVMSFSVRVQRASCSGDDISSSEDYDILISLIAQVKELMSESGLATLGISGAKKGQTAIIKSVDENGVPQEWEAGDYINTKVMTVTAVGAKGDGVTDDTAAFKTALANYRNVFVPGGTYKLSEGLTIRDACKLELAPDAVLCFTQTSGNCISMKMSAYLCGNHAVIEVPYGFTGNVIYVSTTLNTSVTDVPPFTKWDPQWKTARYITDISISKQDSRGFHYSIDGGCSGTAVYIEADGGAASTFIWGLNFSGIRIAGAFSYGIHAKTIGSGYNHEMRLEALIDACEIGLCLEDCNNAYAAVTVQPRPALTTGEESIAYAKHGIQLIRSRNTDLSGARVWDWNADKTLWTSDAGCEYQHIAMLGNCSGTILNDFLYYEMPSYDIRSLIYTDTPENLEKITILQEPFTRWFKPVDNKPMFYDGSANKELLLKSAFDAAFQTDMVANFDNKLPKSTDADGTIFNGTGYQSGAGWSTDGVTLNTGSEYAEITCTGFIPCAENAVIRFKGMSFASGNDYCRVVLFDSSKAKLMHVNRANLISNASSYYINNYSETEDGCQFTIVSASAAYFKVNVFTSTLSTSPAISVNEEMSYRQEGYLADGIKVKATAVEGGGGTDTSLGLTGATVGQTVKIKAVDKNGVPTEWEAVELPGRPYIVNMTMDADGNITADKTFSEIKAAYDNGKMVKAQSPDAIVPLLYLDDSEAIFGQTNANSGGVLTAYLTCTSANVWSLSRDGFDAHTLGISGASVGQIVKIKTVDASGKPTAWEATDMASGGSEWIKLGDVTVNQTAEFVPLSFESGIVTIDTNAVGYASLPSSGTIGCIVHTIDVKSKTSPVVGMLKPKDYKAGTFEFYNRDSVFQSSAAYDPTTYKISIGNVAMVVLKNIPTNYKRYKSRVTTPVYTNHGIRARYACDGFTEIGCGADSSVNMGGGAIIETEFYPHPYDENYVYRRVRTAYGKFYGGGSGNEFQSFELISSGSGKTKPQESGEISFKVLSMIFVNGTRFELWGTNDD